MGRTRQIKYETFLNSKLGKLSPETRLLFIGLWCIADREGRLKDDPEKIKAQLFPYDILDVDTMLNSLADTDDPFIARYSIDGKRYIQVIHFKDHQHCHRNETDSKHPDMNGIYPDGRQAKIIDGHVIDIPTTCQEHTLDSLRLPTSTSTSSPTPTLTSSFTSPSSSTLTSENDVDEIGEVNKKEKEEIYKGLIAYSMPEKQVQEYFEKVPINKIASAYWSTQTKFAKLGVENFVGYFIGILRNEGLI